MQKNEPKKKIGLIFLILAILVIVSLIVSFFLDMGDAGSLNYNTAIIPVKGEISVDSAAGILSQGGASSTEIVSLVEKAEKDPNVKAVIFEINSPGGSPVATDEISQSIKSLKDHNITTVAWIREEGASGAYWIATSTGYIIADRMSIVGSIGVIGSYIGWYGLMKDYNVTYQRLVSGQYKDTGTPFRPLSSAEEDYLQKKLDKLYGYFIESVAANRNMSIEKVTGLANGEIYLGAEAKENGLIDETGGIAEAEKYLSDALNESIQTKEFAIQKSFLDKIVNAMNTNAFYIGQGISSGLLKENEFKIKT